MISRDPFISTINQLLAMPDEYDTSEGLNNDADSFVLVPHAQTIFTMDVKASQKAFVLIVDLPGVKSSDMSV